MTDVVIKKAGRTGRITLSRPEALNALTLGMIEDISAALPGMATDDGIDMLVIDAEGDRAFCSGGDIADIYAALVAGDPSQARHFWQKEYRLNYALYAFPKPVATFLNGYTMGGGVGVGCHGSHRIVGETSRIAMPECSIGLVPDVGGSLLLARSPGRLGEYLGVTGTRMSGPDAILAGFADYFIPEIGWSDLIARLEATGDWTEIDKAAQPVPHSELAEVAAHIDRHFGGETLRDVMVSLEQDASDWAMKTRETLARNAPLAMASAVELIHRARVRDRMDEALGQEYRFAHRIVDMGDFQEGIRAAIIDKDKSPNWRHAEPKDPTLAEVSAMLRPLGADELKLEE